MSQAAEEDWLLPIELSKGRAVTGSDGVPTVMADGGEHCVVPFPSVACAHFKLSSLCPKSPPWQRFQPRQGSHTVWSDPCL